MNSGRKTHLSDFLYIFPCGFRIYLSISFQINWLSEEFNTSRDMNQTQLSLETFEAVANQINPRYPETDLENIQIK